MRSTSTCCGTSEQRSAGGNDESEDANNVIPKRLRRKMRHNKLHDKYRRLLTQPGLTAEQIEEMRKRVILLARTICEHVWGKKLY